MCMYDAGACRPKYMVMPQNRGELATIATPDKSFECHTYLSKIKAITVTKGKVSKQV